MLVVGVVIVNEGKTNQFQLAHSNDWELSICQHFIVGIKLNKSTNVHSESVTIGFTFLNSNVDVPQSVVWGCQDFFCSFCFTRLAISTEHTNIDWDIFRTS